MKNLLFYILPVGLSALLFFFPQPSPAQASADPNMKIVHTTAPDASAAACTAERGACPIAQSNGGNEGGTGTITVAAKHGVVIPGASATPTPTDGSQ